METVVPPPADAELQLLTQWGDPFERTRTRQAAALSVLAHILLIVILVLLPPELMERPEPEPPHHVTPLYLPLTELTQKTPNKGRVSKEFNSADLEQRPRVPRPSGAPASAPAPPASPMPPAPAPKQTAAAPPPKPAVAPPPQLPEAPKVEAPQPRQQPQTIVAPVVTPPPQIQAEETKTKSPFENPANPPPVSPNAHSPFGNPIEEAIRQATHTPSGNLTLGDSGIFGPGGSGQTPQSPTALGQPGSGLEMLTDQQGVDFRPYLARVLNEVRRHWLSIMPESVKLLGRRGAVAIQFSIDRQGLVPKLVIVPGRSSGIDSLDRAAVAGISASVPFPPLPSEFKGDRIVLQFNFAYNMPKK